MRPELNSRTFGAATTAMLNLFRHGTLVGLEPVRVMFGGALTLIRPLIAEMFRP